MVPCISVSMANSVAGFVPVSLRESPTKRTAMGLSKYQSRWSWRYHLSNKIDGVTLLLLMLLPSGSIDFTGFSMKGNKSNKKIEK